MLKSASKPGTVSFRNSLGTALLIGMLFSLLWTVAGVAVLMDTYGKTLVEQESRRLIEQLGNKIAARIQARSLQVEALGRSLVQGARTWPHDPELYRRRIPMLLDFNDDRDIAGGGIWPEPYVFDGRNRLRSFFFGRDYQSTDAPFRFYNQYNRAPGYFEEEWYAMARFSPPGKCFWSRAYTDPHSGELMVTCSIGIHDPAGFQGAVTVDLSLAGLHAFMQSAHIDLHGDLSPGADTRGTYMFLVDRNNRFITFPDEACGSHTDSETACPVMRREHNQHGRLMPLYLNAGKFARQEPAFAPIADFLERTNLDMIKRAEQSPTFHERQLRAIIASSNSLPEQEARLINAILSDSLDLSGKGRSYFADTVIDAYYRGNSSAHLYVFIIPESYWKLVVLVPEAVAGAVATRLTRIILVVLAAIAFVGGGIAFYYSRRKLILPVRRLVRNVRLMERAINRHEYDRIESIEFQETRSDEVGQLARGIQSLGAELVRNYARLKELNTDMESMVARRTEQLTHARIKAEETISELAQLNHELAEQAYATEQEHRELRASQAGLQRARQFAEEQRRMAEETITEMAQLTHELALTADESERLRKEAQQSRRQLEKAGRKITDAINYSALIQQSFLESERMIRQHLGAAFIIWKPRDIIGGDFYFFAPFARHAFFLLVDCTGHGVAGAFMTMITKAIVDALVNESSIQDPAVLLQQMGNRIRMLLHQDRQDAISDSGLDAAAVCLDANAGHIVYAGARIPLFIRNSGEIRCIRADNRSLAYRRSDPEYVFQNHTIQHQSGDILYLLTDGYTDQLGEHSRLPMGSRKFLEAIQSPGNPTPAEQKSCLLDTLIAYQGTREQTDDITVCALQPDSFFAP